MKKLNSLIVLLLVLCLTASCFVGCGNEAKQDDDDEKTTVTQQNDPQKDDEDDTDTDDNVQQVTGTFDDCLMLEQIGVVGKTNFSVYGGGLVYKDSAANKYGIISVEGLIDSGAIYDAVKETGVYFSVMTKRANDPNDLSGLNTFALVNGKGRQIVGPHYASYSLYGDFVVAYKATGRNDEDGDINIYDSDVFEAKIESSVHYDGKWEVYHLKTGAKIPDLEGTGYFSGFDQGTFLRYHNGDEYVTVDANGKPLAEDAKMFGDGSYAIESRIGEVFAADGSKLFAYDLTGYIPYETDGTHYVAKRYADAVNTYVIMDKTGKIVSTEFDEQITLVGNLVLCNEILQNFDGETVLKGTCSSIKQDRMFGQYYVARAGDVYTMLDDTGDVYVSVEYDDEHAFYVDDFVAYDKTSGDYMFYCHKTQSFDIKGYSMSPWMVKVVGDNNTYDLVDTMTGDTLLSGYSNYSYNTRNPETYYIYAKHDRGADVFLATSMKGFQSVTQKKDDLYNELSAAFKAEGLTVTVNRETGELAMDSSVLFGGDSAALTAEGKEFLNKFIKVYSSVAFSAKYNGFISGTMIEGHTAPVAGSTYASGLSLSQERAANVKNYILSGETGVDLSAKANTFEDVGRSNSQPVYNEDGSVNMDASRRVSFRFLVNVNG